jgi:hypothetical protein
MQNIMTVLMSFIVLWATSSLGTRESKAPAKWDRDAETYRFPDEDQIEPVLQGIVRVAKKADTHAPTEPAPTEPIKITIEPMFAPESELVPVVIGTSIKQPAQVEWLIRNLLVHDLEHKIDSPRLILPKGLAEAYIQTPRVNRIIDRMKENGGVLFKRIHDHGTSTLEIRYLPEARFKLDPSWLANPFFAAPSANRNVFKEIVKLALLFERAEQEFQGIIDEQIKRDEPLKISENHSAYKELKHYSKVRQLEWHLLGIMASEALPNGMSSYMIFEVVALMYEMLRHGALSPINHLRSPLFLHNSPLAPDAIATVWYQRGNYGQSVAHAYYEWLKESTYRILVSLYPRAAGFRKSIGLSLEMPDRILQIRSDTAVKYVTRLPMAVLGDAGLASKSIPPAHLLPTPSSAASLGQTGAGAIPAKVEVSSPKPAVKFAESKESKSAKKERAVSSRPVAAPAKAAVPAGEKALVRQEALFSDQERTLAFSVLKSAEQGMFKALFSSGRHNYDARYERKDLKRLLSQIQIRLKGSGIDLGDSLISQFDKHKHLFHAGGKQGGKELPADWVEIILATVFVPLGVFLPNWEPTSAHMSAAKTLHEKRMRHLKGLQDLERAAAL